MKLDATDRALIGVVLASLTGLVMLLAILPSVAKADQPAPKVILDCTLAKLTDEPAKVRGHYVAIMREDGKRAMYRHLPHHRAYQIFAGNGPQMQQEYLCLPPLPEIDLQGDDHE